MNVTPTIPTLPPAPPAGAQPAVAFAASGAGPAELPSPAPVQDGAAPFAQWLALPELPLDAAPPEPEQDDTGTAEAAADVPDAGAAPAPAPAPSAPQDMALMAAMAAPLVAPPAQSAATAPAGAAPRDGNGGAGRDVLLAAIGRPAQPVPAPDAAAARPDAVAAAGATAAGEQNELAPLLAQLSPVAADSAGKAAEGAAAQARPAAAAMPGQAGAAPGEATGADRPAVAPAAPAWNPSVPAAQGFAPHAAATVALDGPPAAWRQTLHSALGERLQMQAGGNVDQAVIRLEPPNLGRIDIAIRHSAGALEVSLSATHSEVVRQLHAVTDSLRNDLASRQYSEVSVTVAQAAPRAQQSASNPFADQQGRGRQPSREQDDTAPGMALAQENNPDKRFSLNGRDS